MLASRPGYGGDHQAAVAGDPDAHTIARLIEPVEVLPQLSEVCEPVVFSGLEAQHVHRGGVEEDERN